MSKGGYLVCPPERETALGRTIAKFPSYASAERIYIMGDESPIGPPISECRIRVRVSQDIEWIQCWIFNNGHLLYAPMHTKK